MRQVLWPVLAAATLAVPAPVRAQQHATVTGRVTGATSRRGVDAALIALDDGRSARADSHGGFVIKDLPPGTYRMRVSRIGYRPKTLSVPIEPEDARHQIFVDVSLEPLPVQMEPVVIRGDTSSVVAYGRIADFYRHRRSGWGGRFVTRADIERRQPFRISDMLVSLPGVWSSYNTFGDRVFAFSRSLNSWASRRGGCGPAVFLDGARVADWLPIDDLVSPEQVEGIEVYDGWLNSPMEYAGGCGAIAIWTRG